MKTAANILTALVSLSVLGLIVGAGTFVALLVYFSRDLPDYRQLENYEPPIVTRAYASDGKLLAEFATEKRVFVPIQAVPDLVIDAFLAAEDKNFYHHPGIDITGIARAALTNLRNLGHSRRPVGASTITQQVAKNFLLSNEVSIARKAKEAILAFRIEKTFSKDKILELYLNEIYLGRRAYGVAAASLEYFNKPLEELTLEEAAYLAALPKAPNNYHPVRRYESAVGRRNWVIDRMREENFITQDQADLAKQTALTTHTRDSSQYVNAPYFAEEVRRRLMELYGEKGLYQGGLIAQTTMIPAYQQTAEKVLRTGLMAYDMRRNPYRGPVASLESIDDWQEQLRETTPPAGKGDLTLAVVLQTSGPAAKIGFIDGTTGTLPFDLMKWARLQGKDLPKKPSDSLNVGDIILVEPADTKKKTYALRQIPHVQGGLIALDPHNGRIYAIAGGFSYEMSEFNRATQAIRQPGSAFKPFVYLAGLENGFTPATLVQDAPFVLDQGGNLGTWRPQNYTEDFSGPTPLRVGIEKSRNLMTIRLASYVGMDKVSEIAKRFGISDNLPPLLSMSIGAGETTLLRMATGYSTFVNGGKRITPTFINRIQDRNGKTIFASDRRPCEGCGPMIAWEGQDVPNIPDTREEIADPKIMYQIVSMMEGVVQRGTGVMMRSLNRPFAGKTGTTNDAKDAWFIGYTPDLVIGVYIGYDEPRSLGPRETGSRVAVPVVRDFMQQALKDIPPTPFRVPQGIRLVQINAETGTRVQPGDQKIIWEAFLPGTEPGELPTMFTGNMVEAVSDISGASQGVDTGLGGLY